MVHINKKHVQLKLNKKIKKNKKPVKFIKKYIKNHKISKNINRLKMNNKADYYWNILNESSSSYIYLTESVWAFVCCSRLDFVIESC